MNTFTCPRCGRSSPQPEDIQHGYCGACHDWTRPPLLVTAPVVVAQKWVRGFGMSMAASLVMFVGVMFVDPTSGTLWTLWGLSVCMMVAFHARIMWLLARVLRQLPPRGDGPRPPE